MMSSARAEFCRLERPVEVYENQRLWIGRGFSRAGLLPTERGPYSTKDGSLSWRTLPEAGLGLLRGEFGAVVGINGRAGRNNNNGKLPPQRVRRGWSFHEEDRDPAASNNLRGEDEYECSDENSKGDYLPVKEYECGFIPCSGPEDGPTDGEDGWQYFPDFAPQSLLNPSRKRGMLDFVRRRKLIRIAIFRPDHFLPLEVYAKCDFCDSNVVKMLSGAMLDALALATLFAHGPKGNLTDAQVLPLKSKLIDSLSIGANCSYGATENDDYDPWEDLTKIKDRLCAFAETCVGRPGPVAQLLNPDVHQNVINAMPARRREMVRYLNDRERTNLAQLLIKDADRYTFRFHCRYSSCACAGESNSDGDDEENLCEFRFIQCPNRNCNESFSFKHQAEHDEGCGFKCVPCPSECGERIPRNEMHIHVRDRCILRRAECPLSVVGCTATVRAGDIPAHLKDHADQHFVLIAHRMMEYQSVMKDMNARIRALEERNGRLERELQEATSQLQSKNDAKATLNNVKKLTKRLATMEAMCRKEFRKTEEDRKRRN